MRYYIVTVTCALTMMILIFAQNVMSHSSEEGLESYTKDTSNVNELLDMAYETAGVDKNEALKYANDALKLSVKIKYQEGEARSYHRLGNIYLLHSDYEKSLEYLFMGLEKFEQLKILRGIIITSKNIGVAYYAQGVYQKAINYYLKALAVAEETKDVKNNSDLLINLGALYTRLGNYEKALEYLLKAYTLNKANSNDEAMADAALNIGGTYYEQHNYEKALKNFKEALSIAERIDYKSLIAKCNENIGVIYADQGNNVKAKQHYLAALKIKELIGDKESLIVSYTNLSVLYTDLKESDKAMEYLKKSLDLAIKIGYKYLIQTGYLELARLYADMHDYKYAYQYHQLYSQVRDSLYNEESSKQVAEMQTKYETEKKEKQIEIQHLEISKKDLELNQKQITIYATVGGIFLLLLLSLFIYRSYRLKQRANIIITKQKEEVEKQKDIIQQKNKDITDSIRYAENIQQAILPLVEDIKKVLPDSFVLFKPKDIVSGDFYFFANIHTHRPPLDRGGVPSRGFPPLKRGGQGVCNENGLIILAACDSTGHGVPGAFMSMLGSQLLNEIVNDKSITDAAEVLNQLRKGIIRAFGEAGATGEQKDGMDMVLCVFNMKTNQLQYAGANNPLYIIHPVIPIPIHQERPPLDNATTKGEEPNSSINELTEIKPNLSAETSNHNYKLYEVKADKQPIGYTAGEQKPFTNHDIQLEKGDTIYMSSDGYQDQFGGESGKKFMRKQFKQLVLEIQGMGMEEQKVHLNKTIEEWKGRGEQVDDILVIGVRV